MIMEWCCCYRKDGDTAMGESFSPPACFLTLNSSSIFILRLHKSLILKSPVMTLGVEILFIYLFIRLDMVMIVKPARWWSQQKEKVLTSHNGEQSQHQQQPPAVRHGARLEPGKVFTRMERPPTPRTPRSVAPPPPFHTLPGIMTSAWAMFSSSSSPWWGGNTNAEMNPRCGAARWAVRGAWRGGCCCRPTRSPLRSDALDRRGRGAWRSREGRMHLQRLHISEPCQAASFLSHLLKILGTNRMSIIDLPVTLSE